MKEGEGKEGGGRAPIEMMPPPQTRVLNTPLLTTAASVVDFALRTANSLWDSVQLVAQRNALSTSRPHQSKMLTCNIKPSELEALVSDRDTWRTVCDTAWPREFLNRLDHCL